MMDGTAELEATMKLTIETRRHSDAVRVIQDFDEWLRRLWKYHDAETVPILEAREELGRLCEERNVRLWEGR